MKVMITGHMHERCKGREVEIEDWIVHTLQKLHPDECITGCAKGVDSVFAWQAMYLNLPLVCAFPYKHDLSPAEQRMKDYAKEVHVQTDTWHKSCYLDRDKWMVDRAGVVLVVWGGRPGGGAYYTKQYAEKLGKQIIYFPWSTNENGSN